MALVGGLPATLSRLRDAGIWVVGLDDAADRSLFDLGDLAAEGICLVLGAEGAGSVAARPRAVRPRRQHPDARPPQLAQRVGGRGPGHLRDRPPPNVNGRHRTPPCHPRGVQRPGNSDTRATFRPVARAVQTAALRVHVRSRGWGGLEILEGNSRLAMPAGGDADHRVGPGGVGAAGRRRRVPDEGAVGGRRRLVSIFGLPGGGLGTSRRPRPPSPITSRPSVRRRARRRWISSATPRAASSSANTSRTSAALPGSTARHAGRAEQRHRARPTCSTVLGPACAAACEQMAAGSPFLAQLNAGDQSVGSVAYTNLGTTVQDMLASFPTPRRTWTPATATSPT